MASSQVPIFEVGAVRVFEVAKGWTVKVGRATVATIQSNAQDACDFADMIESRYDDGGEPV